MTATSTLWTVAGIVALATVAVSVANLLFLYLNARATRKHEERMARDALDQRRFEETYVEFATLMHRVADWATNQTSFSVPGGPGPSRIPDSEVSKIIGRVKTFASDPVRELADRWADLLGEVIEAGIGGNPTDLEIAVRNLQEQERAVLEVVRRELMNE